MRLPLLGYQCEGSRTIPRPYGTSTKNTSLSIKMNWNDFWINRFQPLPTSPLPTTPLTLSLTTGGESTATSWSDIKLGGDGEGVLAVSSTMFGEGTSRRRCCQGGVEESKENVLHRLVGTHGTARKERGRRRRKSP